MYAKTLTTEQMFGKLKELAVNNQIRTYKTELAEKLGYTSMGASGFKNNLNKLLENKLIDISYLESQDYKKKLMLITIKNNKNIKLLNNKSQKQKSKDLVIEKVLNIHKLSDKERINYLLSIMIDSSENDILKISKNKLFKELNYESYSLLREDLKNLCRNNKIKILKNGSTKSSITIFLINISNSKLRKEIASSDIKEELNNEELKEINNEIENKITNTSEENIIAQPIIDNQIVDEIIDKKSKEERLEYLLNIIKSLKNEQAIIEISKNDLMQKTKYKEFHRFNLDLMALWENNKIQFLSIAQDDSKTIKILDISDTIINSNKDLINTEQLNFLTENLSNMQKPIANVDAVFDNFVNAFNELKLKCMEQAELITKLQNDITNQVSQEELNEYKNKINEQAIKIERYQLIHQKWVQRAVQYNELLSEE